MKIGIIREGKIPPDKRVAFSPEQCKEITENYKNIEIAVQKSAIRIFEDEAYANQNIAVVNDISDCDILIGIKEVPVQQLIPHKTYFFFSHTTKQQPHNQKLLKAAIEKNIQLVDYEHLTDVNNRRIIGFGRFAGIVGCYNAFYAYGKRTGKYELKRAHLCKDKTEMEKELSKIILPNNYKVILTGSGRVSKGAQEVLDLLPIKRVAPSEIRTENYTYPVYAVLNASDYYTPMGEGDFVKEEFYRSPENFRSTFMHYASVADMYIACHFWNPKAPKILGANDLKLPELKLKVIADISCDTNGPIASTIRASSIEDPLYGYNPITQREVNFDDEAGITVMAIDNLPCELSKDASTFFGRVFLDKILPHFLKDTEKIMERATICKDGRLTDRYAYLKAYVEG